MGYNVHCVGIFGEFEKTRLGFGFGPEFGGLFRNRSKARRTHNNRPFY